MELERAVERLAGALLRYCLALTGDRALAEDVAQDALAALVGRWRRHGPPDSADRFVFAIARRRAWRAVTRRRLFAPLKHLVNGHADEPSPAAAPNLERRISVDLERAPAADVLNSFGDILEIEVEIVDGVDGLVTLRVENVSIRTVMTAVCESIGCGWQLADAEDPPTLLFEPIAGAPERRRDETAVLDKRLNISLLDASAETVFRSFATILESELQSECDGLEETVSVELEGVRVRDAIERVCASIRCVCVYEPGVLTVRSPDAPAGL